MFIIGPQSIVDMEPTHIMTRSGKITLKAHLTKSKDPGSTNTNESPPTATTATSGLFGSINSSVLWLPSTDMNAVVWDRLPREDYDEIEMPSKVKWFVGLL